MLNTVLEGEEKERRDKRMERCVLLDIYMFKRKYLLNTSHAHSLFEFPVKKKFREHFSLNLSYNRFTKPLHR